MAHRYKLKELEVGDVKSSSLTKDTVTDIDPNTGAISWDIDYIPNLDKLLDDSSDLVQTAKGVYVKTKDDTKFRDIYEQARALRNTIRTHVRNNYPEEYKKSVGMNEEDVEEMSMSGGAGAYLTPYAFKKKKKLKEDESNYPSFEVDRNIKYQDTVITQGYWTYTGKESGGKGVYLNTSNQQMLGFNREDLEIFKNNLSSHFNILDESAEQPGEDLGPGPKATEDGVKDNAYVKQFKYKLVPKTNGTYVQKGSGLEVNKLF
jgi:hypothetical protein